MQAWKYAEFLSPSDAHLCLAFCRQKDVSVLIHCLRRALALLRAKQVEGETRLSNAASEWATSSSASQRSWKISPKVDRLHSDNGFLVALRWNMTHSNELTCCIEDHAN
ncbi:uncharacterized protein M6B38_344800 [Iris pallida]|uniref:Uncharacterized protein n=1 Tax=Iris pallida TaxID=29817 RepID=A0AAX6GV44_IRIPA|nr:uncharacterized protein M6B38_344800 [Iris pallida]